MPISGSSIHRNSRSPLLSPFLLHYSHTRSVQWTHNGLTSSRNKSLRRDAERKGWSRVDRMDEDCKNMRDSRSRETTCESCELEDCWRTFEVSTKKAMNFTSSKVHFTCPSNAAFSACNRKSSAVLPLHSATPRVIELYSNNEFIFTIRPQTTTGYFHWPHNSFTKIIPQTILMNNLSHNSQAFITISWICTCIKIANRIRIGRYGHDWLIIHYSGKAMILLVLSLT